MYAGFLIQLLKCKPALTQHQRMCKRLHGFLHFLLTTHFLPGACVDTALDLVDGHQVWKQGLLTVT